MPPRGGCEHSTTRAHAASQAASTGRGEACNQLQPYGTQCAASHGTQHSHQGPCCCRQHTVATAGWRADMRLRARQCRPTTAWRCQGAAMPVCAPVHTARRRCSMHALFLLAGSCNAARVHGSQCTIQLACWHVGCCNYNLDPTPRADGGLGTSTCISAAAHTYTQAQHTVPHGCTKAQGAQGVQRRRLQRRLERGPPTDTIRVQ